jgi:alkylation response protein AidB-like acyl-CoA dehydrogenase
LDFDAKDVEELDARAKVNNAGRDADTVALVIDLESEGVSRSETLDLMSFRGMPLGELSFDNVKVRPVRH